MTAPEVVQLRTVIESLWPNAKRLEDTAVLIWQRVLADTDLERATAAVVAMNRDGREWEPTPGQIATATEPLGNALPYGEAKQLLLDALARFGAGGEAAGLRWLAERSPQTARWAASGWRTLALAPISGEHGGIVDRDWRADYRSVVERMEGERARGQIAPVVSGRIAQLERGDAKLLERSLNPLDVLAHIGGVVRDEIEAGR